MIMIKNPKLSLWAAVLVNINIMLGSGLFINTVLLSTYAGAASPLVYIGVGLLFFPLMYTMAHLMTLHKGGTFYDFGAEIHPFVGFISSWTYFTAKMASSFLSMHIFVTLMQQIFPVLAAFSPLYYDVLLITLFVWLNSFNLKMGSTIQGSFLLFKLLPLLCALITGLFLCKISFFGLSDFVWTGIPLSFPLVIFAFSGFEASCSLSKNIQDPEKNGPRALFLSYSFVLILAVSYQFLFYGSLGTKLAELSSFKQAFPLLFSTAGFLPNSALFLSSLAYIGIAVSALGASYGIMYSNAWNLYTLAQNKHIFYASFFARLNKHGVPFICIVAEGLLAFFYLALTQGNQVPLQQISALGSTVAYTLSVLSCFILLKKSHRKISLLVFLAFISCALFIGSLLYAYSQKGASSLLLFGALFCFGIIQYLFAQHKTYKIDIHSFKE